jgi:predicted small secreted protein
MKEIRMSIWRRIQMLSVFVVAAGFVVAAAGCNTTKGVGRDIERAGEGLQDAVDDAKD